MPELKKYSLLSLGFLELALFIYIEFHGLKLLDVKEGITNLCKNEQF